jgi:hypothetical protein
VSREVVQRPVERRVGELELLVAREPIHGHGSKGPCVPVESSVLDLERPTVDISVADVEVENLVDYT